MIFSDALSAAGETAVVHEAGEWVTGTSLMAAGRAVADDLAGAAALVCRSPSMVGVITAAIAAESLGTSVTFVDPRLALDTVGIEVDERAAAPVTAEVFPAGSTLVEPLRNPGYHFLSSGSTAAPTRVVRPAAATLADSRQIGRAVYAEHGDVALAAPGFHSYGFSHLAAALGSGRRVVAVRPNATASALSAVAALDGIGVFAGMPFHLDLVLGRGGPCTFSKLRTVVSSAGRLGPETIERSLAAGIPLHNAYGSTETGTLTIGAVGSTPDSAGYVGRPLDGVEVRLVPGCEPGSEVLQVRTGGLAGGIVRERRYVELENGWYTTGDVADVNEQGIWLRGREADFLKVSGIRVSCARIRDIVLRHPDVLEVEVHGANDRIRGEVAACRVVAEPGLRVEDLQTWCRQHLNAEEIPRIIEFVDHIPRSATGKPLRVS